MIPDAFWWGVSAGAVAMYVGVSILYWLDER